MPKVSIIVPVYNAEKYLEQCVDSLLAQSLEDIEIILVNDGSTDSSLNLCDYYSQIDSRIIVMSQLNEGAASARKKGLFRASAKYVTFIDSDDFYEKDYCKMMLDCLEETESDIVECDYYSVVQGNKREHQIYSHDMTLNKDDFRTVVYRTTILNGSEAVVLWNKMYRRDLIIGSVVEYGNNLLEDYLFNLQYYTVVNRYSYIHKCLTNYRQTSSSLSKRVDYRTIEVLKDVNKTKIMSMERMEINSAEDYAEAATWFIAYVENYLVRLMLIDSGRFNKDIIKVLNDPVVIRESQLSSNRSLFARSVGSGCKLLVIFYIKYRVYGIKIKTRIARVKQKVLSIQGCE